MLRSRIASRTAPRVGEVASAKGCSGGRSPRAFVVITTGAAPGFFALRLGKLMGARVVWLDSIANASALSLAGQKAGKHADLWLTQWPELASEDGPDYRGSVL